MHRAVLEEDSWQKRLIWGARIRAQIAPHVANPRVAGRGLSGARREGEANRPRSVPTVSAHTLALVHTTRWSRCRPMEPSLCEEMDRRTPGTKGS